jgi:dephospho-CoA kinase
VLRVGLTGGIGAGKSTVARALAALGAVVVDADLLARRVVEPGSPGLGAVVEAFGPQVLTPDGALDRPALGRLVFADDDARARLNAVLHPRIAALTAQEIAAAAPDAVVVHDVPLLVENGLGANYHLVLVVTAPAEERLRRLVADRGMAEQDARARIAAQADDDARVAAADVLLDNDGAPGALTGTVERLWRERLLPFEANVRARRPAPRPAPPPVAAPDPARPGVAARVAARVARAAGDRALRVEHVDPTAAPGTVVGAAAPDVVGLRLTVADAAAADAVREPLAEAGFPRVGGGAGPGEWLHQGCDPARAVDLLVVAEGG